MNCYHCRFSFDAPKAATNAGTGLDAPSPNTAGAIFFCGQCGHVNVSDSGGLRAITEQEWNDLDEQTRKDLHFAIRRILAVYKKRNIKIVNPVDEFIKQIKSRN